MYQHKSFLNGKTGIAQVKQTGRGFQKAPQYRSNNFLYAVAELKLYPPSRLMSKVQILLLETE